MHRCVHDTLVNSTASCQTPYATPVNTRSATEAIMMDGAPRTCRQTAPTSSGRHTEVKMAAS